MNSKRVRRSTAIGSFISAGLLTIGLVASVSCSLHAQTSGAWASTGALNTPHIAHTATLLAHGKVLAAGGEDTGGNLIASAELYNPATGKWIVTGSLATPRYHHTATLLANGEVLVAGGVSGTYTATAELHTRPLGDGRARAA